MTHQKSCLCCAPPTGAGTVRIEASGKNPLQTAPDASKGELKLKDFKPRSMLRVPQTLIERPRFPVIDMHAHLTWSKNVRSGVSVGEEITAFSTPEALLPVMDRKGVRTLVNLTGGVGKGLEESIRLFDQAAPGRFLTLTEPSFALFPEPDYPQRQADAIEHARRVGARGLKLLKTLGLYLRERIDDGPLVGVDDRRFDQMWEACAAHDLPVFLHVSDPEAFFLPTDGENERYEELANHPDWSFYGPEFPSHQELIAARNRMIARHPDTTLYCCTWATTPRTWPRSRIASPVSRTPWWTSARASASWAASRASPSASSTAIRTASCSAPTRCPRRGATTYPSSCSATRCTRSTTASWKPRTSISTTPPPRYRRRGAGPSTG